MSETDRNASILECKATVEEIKKLIEDAKAMKNSLYCFRFPQNADL